MKESQMMENKKKFLLIIYYRLLAIKVFIQSIEEKSLKFKLPPNFILANISKRLKKIILLYWIIYGLKFKNFE